jgi:hypothetical protein
MAIADLIHSCGLPFSLASHHKFKRGLNLAKSATSNFKPPGRNKVAGELLDLNFQLYREDMKTKLIKDAQFFGISFFGDGATVKKTPMVNILASSVYLPAGCLRIVDCSGHLENNGKKDAAYITELFLPHITEMEEAVPKCTDLVIFDGASNVQKAGSLLEAKFPQISVIHGAEHVISLFYSDVFNLPAFNVLKRINKLIYRYFGSGSMHSPYAIFSKHTREHNNKRSIGLICAADTRMAGHVISMLRTLRLKDPLLSTISSAVFLQGKFKVSPPHPVPSPHHFSHQFQIEKRFIDILKRDTTWEFMTKFVRAVFPMLIVLRLADRKLPVMDKLYFYVRRMDKTLEKSKAILDEIESKTQGQYWRTVNDLTIDDNIPDDDTDNDSFYEESDSNTDSTSSSDEETKSTKTLGDKLINIWNKRRYKLVTDFAIAGWLLSPIPDIYEDSKIHMNGHHCKESTIVRGRKRNFKNVPHRTKH